MYDLQSVVFPDPAPVVWSRCARCRKPARKDRLVFGFGRDCAQLLGLTAAPVRLDTGGQSGPDLFDAAEETDSCDGWDRSGDRA